MNTDDLRHALQDEATAQPAVDPAFVAGVDRRVRGQRLRAGLLAVPAVAAVLVAGALALPKGGGEASLDTASSTSGTTVAAPGTTTVTVPKVTTTVGETPTSVADAPTTTAAVPSPPPTAAPVPAGGSCGTVTYSQANLKTVDNRPVTCFLEAVNAGAPSDLTVIVDTGGNGSVTSSMVLHADRSITATVNGSLSMPLPAFAFGGKAGVAPADKDCGTISVSTAGLGGGGGGMPTLDKTALQCVTQVFMGGGSGSLKVVVTDAKGGAITASVTIGADHTVSITINGTIEVQLPPGAKVPEDLLNAIPPNGMGLGSIPGIGGAGGPGGAGGAGGSGKPNMAEALAKFCQPANGAPAPAICQKLPH